MEGYYHYLLQGQLKVLFSPTKVSIKPFYKYIYIPFPQTFYLVVFQYMALSNKETVSAIGSDLYSENKNNEEQLEELEKFLNSIPARRGTFSLEKLSDILASEEYRRHYYIFASRSWSEFDDLKQSARIGIFQGWVEICSNSELYQNYSAHFRERVQEDEIFSKRLKEEAHDRQLTVDQLLQEKIPLGWLYRCGKNEVRRMIQKNVGSSKTKRKQGETATSNFTFYDSTNEDDDFDVLDRLLTTTEADRNVDFAGSYMLANRNTPSHTIIRNTCALLDIDEQMNFPERDREQDSIKIQELFVESLREVLSENRMSSGVGPDGKPRYRKLDPITSELENWCIDVMLCDGESSIGLAYIKEILRKEPFNWSYEYPHYSRRGAKKKEVDDYTYVVSALRSLILRMSKNPTYVERTDRYPKNWFNEQGDLIIDFIPNNLINQAIALSPTLGAGYELRRSAWGRVREMLVDRRDAVIETFDNKVCDYLMKEKGETRIW